MLESAAPLLLVGAGKMGGAMLERWLELGLPAAGVTIVDPYLDEGAKQAWSGRGVRVEAAEAAPPAVIVLAVKPQSMETVLPAIAGRAGPATIVISIAAGVGLGRIAAAFPAGQPVVRVMPNTPAQVGKGMSVACANDRLDAGGRALVDALLGAVGEAAWIDDEGHIDAVTAVSGSGPAYVFLLAECLAEAGRQAGLPAGLADRLARQTVVGGGALLAESALPASKLRENVTSPNGTTAAALAVLMAADGLQSLLTKAVAAARARSLELG
ncbi:pyrroline-5-carboxylate reductase [Propylenella binzhouense]|uniref:Pyrroline-5-carboxylate reductase n=1 Tax=Propylenella binzhouense TaxID=2555902 RepID=A0A964T7L6_9HYPH|nr:pyrroline-5-carboxylate reductase [Propylenella binzhouense]MYZ48852.1 pyrroline-5-carboxylate reductase [Propylenella binzhouense]